MNHITDHDLERYYLGMVEGVELAALETHILACPPCAERAEETRDYVDAMRAAIIKGGYDLQGTGGGSLKPKEQFLAAHILIAHLREQLRLIDKEIVALERSYTRRGTRRSRHRPRSV